MFKKILFLFALLLSAGFAFSQGFPAKPDESPVADFTNTLSAEQKQQLDAKLKAFEDSTSTQIAVVIIKSVGDYDINDYGTKLGRAWGVGGKENNNGVVLLIALDDRKLAIQTGYGLEGALPDITTQEIIRNDITPRFKAGDYYGGIDAGTDQIIKATKGEYKQTVTKKKRRGDSGGGGSAGLIAIIVIVVIIMIFRNRGGGGGGQIIGRRGGASPFWWFLAGNMLGGGSRGGGWGGSSGGGFGGGDSGGGWGGFGGGSFGGGGSSGSW